MLTTHHFRHKRYLPASARAAAATTAGLWTVAVALFTGHAQGDIGLADTTMQLIVYWLLALGCAGFWVAFMRVGEELVDTDWHLAYKLEPEAILATGRDRQLDRALAQGLGADRPPDFWPAKTWKVLIVIGVSSWVISALATVALLTRWLPLRYPERGMLLVILMLPAAQCTAAGMIGPGLTRMLRLRDAAREARSRLCEHTVTLPSPSASAALSASEDLRDTALIPAHALRGLGPGAKDRSLRIIKEDPGPHRGLYN